MKNRICLWLSAIIFALSLFGCSVDVTSDDNSKPKDSTALTSVKVNDVPAKVNQDGKTWVCTVYGAAQTYEISSVVATPEDSNAVVTVVNWTRYKEMFITT